MIYMGPHYLDFKFAFDTTLIRLEMTDIWPKYVAQAFLPPPRIVSSGPPLDRVKKGWNILMLFFVLHICSLRLTILLRWKGPHKHVWIVWTVSLQKPGDKRIMTIIIHKLVISIHRWGYSPKTLSPQTNIYYCLL